MGEGDISGVTRGVSQRTRRRNEETRTEMRY